MQEALEKKRYGFSVKNYFDNERGNNETPCEEKYDYLTGHVFDELWFNSFDPKPRSVRVIDADILSEKLKDVTCDGSIAVPVDGDANVWGTPHTVYYSIGIFKKILMSNADNFEFFAVNEDPSKTNKYSMIFQAHMKDGSIMYCDMSSDIPTRK